MESTEKHAGIRAALAEYDAAVAAAVKKMTALRQAVADDPTTGRGIRATLPQFPDDDLLALIRRTLAQPKKEK